MDDKQIALFLIALFVLVVPLSFGLALWVISRLRRRSDQPLSHDMTGVVVVPVRQLKRSYRFFGYSANSINPRLEITRDGLGFRIFKPDHWRFADIAGVDAPWVPFVTRISIGNPASGRLYIDLADQARARDMLRALPPGLAYTPRAIALRNGAG